MTKDKLIVLIIIVLLTVWRILETVLPDRKKKKGLITANWLFVCLFISGCLITIFTFLEFLLIVTKINKIITIMGLIMVFCRIPLKIWAIKTLNEFWSIQIEIRSNQELITSGPYKYLRHPSYLGTIVEVIGGTLTANAYYTLLFACLIYMPLLLMRIKLEEKELIKKFGIEYKNYMKAIPALFPIRINKKVK